MGEGTPDAEPDWVWRQYQHTCIHFVSASADGTTGPGCRAGATLAAATDAAGHIHDRMPMVVPRDAVDAWLDPTLTDPEQALALLGVTDAAALAAYPVSTLVNSVQNNEPALLDPLPDDDTPDDDPDPAAGEPGPADPPGQERLL